MVFSALTALTVDKEVWFRDIAASPSPFPLLLIFAKIATLLDQSGSENDGAAHTVCLPGCTCTEKLPPSSPPLGIPPIGSEGVNGRIIIRTLTAASGESSVPIRVPTAMERHNSIVIGFDV
jgi:hypothetical protein